MEQQTTLDTSPGWFRYTDATLPRPVSERMHPMVRSTASACRGRMDRFVESATRRMGIRNQKTAVENVTHAGLLNLPPPSPHGQAS